MPGSAPGGGAARVSNADKLLLIAGPCMAESLDMCVEVAGHMKALCARLGIAYVFKASYDKANRSSGSTTRGPGLEAGLALLDSVRAQVGVPLLTDVHESAQAEAAGAVCEVLQVPAFLCRQTDLLLACAAQSAQRGRIVNVKKGQFMAPWDMGNVWDKLVDGGCADAVGADLVSARGPLSETRAETSSAPTKTVRALITERGASFGYNNLVVDYRSLLWLKSQGIPACFDATHSVQLPGGAGTSSGGQREYIPGLTCAALSLGIAALFMEVHPDPSKALSDKETQWPLDKAEALLTRLLELDRWAKG
ncbi:3-deoxy-8-phosphooctulonate synthase [bacterium]|nr:3-deoxy-8-phosphooctulonate synthase [bacterium]